MKKHKKLIIVLVIILIIIAITVFFIIKNKKSNSQEMMGNNMRGGFINEDFDESDMKDFSSMPDDMENLDSDTFEISDKKANKQSKKTTLSSSAEIESALTEKVELHATYYLEEVYVEKNDFVSEGENILKYTNGTYLVAPYDCYIISLNVPDIEGQALNNHYIQISSINSLMVTMNIDETNLEKITTGQEATITVTSLDKTYTGNITHISSIGTNGKFEIEIEFENDGDIKLGMTGTVSITI
jgi:hypothetical protein